MPKWGAGEVYVETLPADLGPEGQPRQGASLTKGQILWLRGITRLQTQVCYSKLILIIHYREYRHLMTYYFHMLVFICMIAVSEN